MSRVSARVILWESEAADGGSLEQAHASEVHRPARREPNGRENAPIGQEIWLRVRTACEEVVEDSDNACGVEAGDLGGITRAGRRDMKVVRDEDVHFW